VRYLSRFSDGIALTLAASFVFGASTLALASVEVAESPGVRGEGVDDRAFTDGHQQAMIEEVDYMLAAFEFSEDFFLTTDVSFDVDPLDEFRGRNELLGASELKRLLELVGFEGDGLRSAWAISMKESTGRPLAYNGDRSTGDNSYGLFQINMIGRLGPARREAFGLEENAELFDPVLNAQIAYEMSKEGTDFGHWGIGPNAYTGGRPGSYPYWLTQFPEEG
jgi:hypothetical protein